MKFNWSVFKKGKTVYWIGGAVILFVIFYLIASKGASSGGDSADTSGGLIYQPSGPTDAQVQASAAISAAQIQANSQTQQYQLQLAALQQQGASDVALATLQAHSQDLATQAAADVTNRQTDAASAVSMAGLTAQTNIAQLQAEYSYDTAKAANEAAITINANNNATSIAGRQIDASTLHDQLQTNLQMFAIQSNNLITQSAIAATANLKKGDRDAALVSIVTGAPSSHGSITGPSINGGAYVDPAQFA